MVAGARAAQVRPAQADTSGVSPRRNVVASVVSLVLLLGWGAATPAGPAAAIEVGEPLARARQAPVPVVTQALPAGYDPVAGYEAQSLCDPTPKPGTRALAALIARTYGSGQSVAISRACGSGGTSEHKEGRALDWMTNGRTRQGRANARAFLSWLLGPDQFGIPLGNATRLGVMYIGWDDMFWAAYDPGRGWTEMNGCLSRPDAGSDTTCHRNHVHISLTWDGASGRTSFWDGTVLAPFCESPGSDAVVPAGGRAADVVALPPVRVLSTREGLGLTVPEQVAPCRLHPSGWHGDLGGILTKVTGLGGVPEAGVAAVAVSVTALGSTAPAIVSVRAPGQEAGVPVVRVRMNGRSGGSAVVPVASDGTIVLTTSAGGTDLIIDVTGYYLVGDQPNLAVAAPIGGRVQPG